MYSWNNYIATQERNCTEINLSDGSNELFYFTNCKLVSLWRVPGYCHISLLIKSWPVSFFSQIIYYRSVLFSVHYSLISFIPAWQCPYLSGLFRHYCLNTIVALWGDWEIMALIFQNFLFEISIIFMEIFIQFYTCITIFVKFCIPHTLSRRQSWCSSLLHL